MVTTAPPKNRQEFEEKARERSRKRFAGQAGGQPPGESQAP